MQHEGCVLQTGQLQLDRPLHAPIGATSAVWPTLVAAREQSWRRVVQHAVQQAADGLLLYGDLGHCDASPDVALMLEDQWRELRSAGVAVVWAQSQPSGHSRCACLQLIQRLTPGQDVDCFSPRSGRRLHFSWDGNRREPAHTDWDIEIHGRPQVEQVRYRQAGHGELVIKTASDALLSPVWKITRSENAGWRGEDCDFAQVREEQWTISLDGCATESEACERILNQIRRARRPLRGRVTLVECRLVDLPLSLTQWLSGWARRTLCDAIQSELPDGVCLSRISAQVGASLDDAWRGAMSTDVAWRELIALQQAPLALDPGCPGPALDAAPILARTRDLLRAELSGAPELSAA